MWKTTSPILSRLAIWFFLHEVNQIIKGLDVKLLAKDSRSDVIWDRYLAARSPQIYPLLVGQILGLQFPRSGLAKVLLEADASRDNRLTPVWLWSWFIPLSGVTEARRVVAAMPFMLFIRQVLTIAW
jgi:hypothetical protein